MAIQQRSEGVPVPTVIISVIAVFVAGLLIGGLVLKFGKKGTGKDCPAPSAAPGAVTKRVRIIPRGYMAQAGRRDALVKVIMSTDFQNPAAKRAFQALQQLHRAYKGKVQTVVMQNPNPRNSDARLAAVAFMAAARKGKLFEYGAKLFQNPRALKKPNLLAYAKQVGLDAKEFDTALSNRMAMRYVRQDQTVLYRLGARNAPAFFVNGVYLAGAQSYANLRKVVDREMAHAQKLVKAGTNPARLYFELMRGAQATLTGNPNPAAARGTGQKGARPSRPVEDPKALYKLPIEGRPFKGAKNAPVVIAEFSDYQCGYCSRINPALKQLVKKYPNDVKVVWFDFPLSFHRQAMPASIASYEVFKQKGNDAFWKFHDKVFANSRQITDANLAKWAQEVGADAKKVLAAVKGRTHERVIRNVMNIGRQLGVRGTPTILVNGKKYRSQRDFPSFSRAVEAELAQAKKIIGKNGVTAANYYAHVTKKGLTRVKYLPGAAGAQPRRRKIPDPNAVYKLALTGKEPFKGPKNALVTIVEYSDYECPFCKWGACIVNLIAKAFPKDVKIVFKNNPIQRIHPNAMAAAQAGLAAHAQKGNAGFWAMHDKIFPTNLCTDKPPMPRVRQWLMENRSKMPRLNAGLFEKYAKELGLNVAKFKADMPKFKDQIMAEQRLALQLGASGTPAFFVNGKYVRGVRPFASFKAMIEREIAAAKKLMAEKKIPLAKLYNTIIASGATRPVFLGEGGKKPAARPVVRRVPARRK